MTGTEPVLRLWAEGVPFAKSKAVVGGRAGTADRANVIEQQHGASPNGATLAARSRTSLRRVAENGKSLNSNRSMHARYGTAAHLGFVNDPRDHSLALSRRKRNGISA